MFTGIVEELGSLLAFQRSSSGFTLLIKARKVTGDLQTGDSLAVNGVCLTVTSREGSERVAADVMPETIRRTNLEDLKPGDTVNLERALMPSGRMGGHFVTGHIDGTGSLLYRREEGNAVVMGFSAPPGVSRYLVEKGSVAIDGISLTVSAFRGDSFEVSLVPHTLSQTNLGQKKNGDKVNLEGDLIGKYVEKYILGMEKEEPETGEAAKEGISIQWLQEKGF